MPSNLRVSLMQGLAAALAIPALIVVGGSAAVAQTEVVIYDFQYSNGAYPYGRLTADTAGNLYGATINGGAHGRGTVYELTPPAVAGGKWTQSVLYSFQGGNDGAVAWGGLVMDSAGNLYGTTEHGGGSGSTCGTSGCGTVFQLVPPTLPGGAWTENILYRFDGKHGDYPVADNLVIDPAGNLYGTTDTGGIYQREPYGGTVFRLSPPTVSGGTWAQSVLHSFGSPHDGINPIGKLVLDQAGNVYGTTEYGGAGTACGTFGGCGIVFQLAPPAVHGASWTETVLYNFQGGNDGGLARGGVVFDKNGSLFGTTLIGGTFNSGTIFELTPQSDAWAETVLYSFIGDPDGAQPIDGVILANSGALYGTTVGGGASGGTVFKLSPPTSTTSDWTETTLLVFSEASDGFNPWGNVLLEKDGKLLGTAALGGKSSLGTVFEIVP
jgi:uncharacterized repeat protein (TIGR03803 family)